MSPISGLSRMIKEIPTESKNAQFGALADALFGEIGRCCSNMFTKAKQNPQLLQPPVLPSFKISQINCYWLVAPLIRAIPTPTSTTTSSNIKARFLKEAATMLEMSRGLSPHNFIRYHPIQEISIPTSKQCRVIF